MFIVIKRKRLFISLICLLIILTLCIVSYSIFIYQNDSVKHTTKNQPEYLIMIQIDEKTLYLFENNVCIKRYPIASGKPGWPSPIGAWKIIKKDDWGEGFGGRWLGLNVKWGEYGIHGTTEEGSIGSSASHGCIRMFNKDVKDLYDIVPVGTPVIIKNGPFGPFGTGFKDLAPGDRGADVLAVQEKLKTLGYFRGKVTGIYEDDLKSAVYKFQKEKKLQIKYTITIEDYNAMGFKEFE